MDVPERFANVCELESFIATPSEELIAMMKRLDGDIMILGVAGKMGVTMAMLAANAIKAAGVEKSVYGVARFSDAEAQAKLEACGVKTITCDLMDQAQVSSLPQVKNIVFMAGRKFGTQGCEDLTWAMNVIVPTIVGERFRNSRITAFSTGCVYPLVPAETCGCTEETTLAPVGEYTQSCLGSDRMFS